MTERRSWTRDEVEVLCASLKREDSRRFICHILQRSGDSISEKITSLGGVVAIRGYNMAGGPRRQHERTLSHR